ncbi:MAG TPA: chemotaxis protein CheW, partial [Pseudomonadales bacterium]|nr:chemotaxis protein CheW [Pseudomonadales bacterium]
MVDRRTSLAVKDVLRDHEQVPDQYLTYLVGGEMFAMKISRIKEIIEFGEITGIPLMPSFISGVINLRGAVVPVIDLALRFGRSASPIGRRT